MQPAIVFISWALVSVLVETVVLHNIPSARIWSDLLFYPVIMLGLDFGLATGVIAVTVLGFVADSMSLVPPGTTIISYVAVLVIVRQVKANIYLEHKAALFFWVAVFSLCKQAAQLIFLSMSGRNSAAFVWSGFLFQGIWDALLGIFLLPLLRKLLYTDWAAVFRRKGIRD